ncbi:uncharacterized protein EV422DRAFT_272412 [Fimicolochytrium jonesii]|uniref:uncharacterized protein n=1 Tax=Fimicolochytrium jonesii TaxID=1396493 RepID=UPI0022FE27F6|nr:uncharacterized protein EV422DRAFT_272412 [Fimicolochytrium jonesii]KAI8816858.1 hypothetical protein EV422DRAFT_272412 [Fimicolochytrium jonesii]
MSITILPMRLQLITLPKASLYGIMQPVVKNLFFREKASFFSYTENALEVSIIADVDTVQHDFAAVSCPGLIICADPFRAMQVDSDSGYGLDNSAQRINEISSPLAKAGVSIFYLSTYQTDYVFVKERRMSLVISTLQAHDFHFFDLDDLDLDCTPPTTPAAGAPTYSDATYSSSSPTRNILHTPFTALSGMDSSPSSPSNPKSSTSSSDDALLQNGKFIARKLIPRYTVRLVGLNREYIDTWALSLVKVFFYEETLTPSSQSSPHSAEPPVAGRFFNYTATEEGISVIADEGLLEVFPEHILNTSASLKALKCIQVDLSDYGLDRCGIVYSMSEPLARSQIDLLYVSTYTTANILVKCTHTPHAVSF